MTSKIWRLRHMIDCTFVREHTGQAFVEGCSCWAKATCDSEDQGSKMSAPPLLYAARSASFLGSHDDDKMLERSVYSREQMGLKPCNVKERSLERTSPKTIGHYIDD